MTEITKRASDFFNSKGVKFLVIRLLTTKDVYEPEQYKKGEEDIPRGIEVQTADGTKVSCINNGSHYECEVLFPDGKDRVFSDTGIEDEDDQDEYFDSSSNDPDCFYRVLTGLAAAVVREEDWEEVKL